MTCKSRYPLIPITNDRRLDRSVNVIGREDCSVEIATPHALAALIQRQKEALLSSWENEVRQLPGARNLERAILHDHIPVLIDELAEELRQPDKSAARLAAFSAAHGKERHANGYDLAQLVEEYKLLRRCIVRTAEDAQLYVVGDANRVISELIDEGIKTSVQAYVERRDSAELKRREEYLKFLVHDLRSPLAAIYYAIALIERELETAAVSERVRNTQSVVKRNIEQMQALITKLLQEEQNIRTAANIKIERAPVYLAAVADSAVRALISLATTSNTQIVNEIPDDLMLNGDRDLLERVYQNLISNAIDSAPGGTVALGATAAADAKVECWVADNGKGVPDEIKDRIFDKFVTASQHRSGIGLGLPIVKQIIEAHGGAIRLESEPGKGTIVRFSLPRG